ncbi:type II toxin-antitoxin system RelE/ParE family toxin [Neisseria lactamica]|uniref:type II toxin-antitoxin system RelE/ParE family toxin n=1 Tax=Neisseria lactamica TaxID=486 RepID=UPI0009B6EB04
MVRLAAGVSDGISGEIAGHFFVYAFAKNDRENISDKEPAALKDLARYAAKCNAQELEALIVKMDLQEI